MKWPKEYNCPKCGNQGTKNGFRKLFTNLRGYRQCFKCKKCGYQYTSDYLKNKSFQAKYLAAYLFSCGIKQHEIAKIFNVSDSAVHYWLESLSIDKESVKPFRKDFKNFLSEELAPSVKNRCHKIIIDPVEHYTIVKYEVPTKDKYWSH